MDPITAIIIGIIGGAGGTVLYALIERSPKLRLWFKRTFLGLDFLVVGDADVGKTSFYSYLRSDLYPDYNPPLNTWEISKNMSFNVDKGGDLGFQIKRSFDIPGQLAPLEQVEEIRKRGPQVLIVFLSTDKDPQVTHQWLRDFLAHLSNAMTNDKKFAKRLKCTTIVLNKIDLITAKELNKRISEIQKSVAEILEPVLGKNIRMVDVLPCTLYYDEGGEKYANKIVLSIVSAIKMNQRLVYK